MHTARSSRTTVAACAIALTAAFAVANSASAAESAAAPAQVRVGWPEGIKTLNLARTTDSLPIMVGHLIGGTLTNFNDTATGVVPGLAANSDVSGDGKVYTFTLRPDLHFSDGSPLTSADVKATFDTARADKANSNAADYDAWTSVEAPTPDTVVIKLSAPQPGLPSLLAAPWHMILPANAASKGAAFFNNPVTAGPYMVESIANGGANVTLVANPNYYGTKPSIAKFVFNQVDDQNTRIVQLKSHQIDVAGELDPSTLSQLDGDGVASEVVRTFGAYYLWMNDRKQPLADVNVRRAISYAINRDQINKIVWGGQNTPLGGLFPSTMREHVNNIPIVQDIAKAKELLKGTACESGCTIKIMVRNGRPIDQKNAVIMQQNLQEIGITLQIESVDNSVASDREMSGDFDTEGEWLGLPLDNPDVYLNYAVLSTGGINALFSGYSSPEMDAAVGKVKSSTGDARAAAIATVNEIFARDLPYVPLNDYATVLGWNTAVQPYVSFGANGLFDVK